MNEKPVERLNYFNGQRLQAADFKLEQEYHMRVRRWLNRSLYTPGIASGLEVYKIEGTPPRVKILPGLAIDHLGREIILLEEQNFPVTGQAGGNGSACTGPYLTIRYQEEVVAQQDASCAVGGDSADKPAWRGPARILAEPVLELNADLPHESSGKIALACLTLAKGCASVERVDTGVRRYIGEASAANVRQYALEGVRDLDEDNPTTVIFHVRGRQPTSVTLFLRAERFPTYFYTELGKHTHGLNLGQSALTEDAQPNTIPISELAGKLQASNKNSGHPHGFEAYRFRLTGANNTTGNVDNGDLAFLLFNKDESLVVLQTGGIAAPPQPIIPVPYSFPGGATHDDITFQVKGKFTGGGHIHDEIVGLTGTETISYPHKHNFTPTGSNTDFGASIAADKSGLSLGFVNDLQISIDGVAVTPTVRTQIKNSRPDDEDWSKLGQGTGSLTDPKDPLAAVGTGPVRLDYLVPLGEGEHVIKLWVPATPAKRNGGRIHFNLYVE